MDLVVLEIEAARTLVNGALSSIVPNDKDREAIVAHLISAELRGYPSHGLARIPSIINCEQGSSFGSRVLSVDLGCFVFLDGGRSQGIATVKELLDVAATRAEHQGAVVAAASNFTGTTGCLGVYGAAMAERGLVSIQFCHSVAVVAPHGTCEPVLGTNPIAISLPGRGVPFVADLATSVRSHGSLKRAIERGVELQTGVIQDVDGLDSISHGDLDTGSLLPMGGYKGFALGLAIEAICGPVLGGKAGRVAVEGSDSYFSVIFRADNVRSMEDIERDCEKLYTEIRTRQLRPDGHAVHIPGERAKIASKQITVTNALYEFIMMLQ